MSEQKPRPEDGQREFADVAWSVPSYLLSGMIIWGGIGWLLDWWLGTRGFVAVGIVLGAAGGIWLVWLRYSKP